MAGLGKCANRLGSMVRGSGRYIRPAVDDLWMQRANAVGCPLCRWPLHHVRLLVYSLDFLCQSSRDDCAFTLGYFCWHRTCRCDPIHRGATHRDVCRPHRCALVLALGVVSGKGGSKPAPTAQRFYLTTSVVRRCVASALSLRYLLHPSRRIGFEINDQATYANTQTDQRIFQRHKCGQPEKA